MCSSTLLPPLALLPALMLILPCWLVLLRVSLFLLRPLLLRRLAIHPSVLPQLGHRLGTTSTSPSPSPLPLALPLG